MIKRKITPLLLQALTDSPVVLVHGARQTGKSALVQQIAAKEYPAKYITFDDTTIFSAAKNNPLDFLNAYSENLIIDEVQRVPEIFLTLKNIIDKKRKPGKFILTGSANVLLLPKISESLAGRMEILTLYPFSQSELNGSPNNFVDTAFNKDFKPSGNFNKKNNYVQRILSGGFPEMLSRTERTRQNAWFKAYVTTILQRDVRDISNIEKLSELPRLLKLFAARAGTLLNFAEFSRSAAIPQTTLKRYIALLESVFMVHLLPAWSGNLSKRLIKTPKLYLNDTGLLSHLVSFDANKITADPLAWGRVVENFVLLELLKLCSWCGDNLSVYYYRTSTGQEVDFVIERNDGALIGIEVKASSSVSAENFNHLKSFAEETGKKFVRGFLFYTGDEIIPFAKNLFAVPVSALW